jgi:site-specific recombinase XerD
MTDIVETRLNKAISKKQINNEIAKVLSEFDRYNKVKGLTEISRLNQIQQLIKFSSKVKKDFKDLTKKDIEIYFAEKNYSSYSNQIIMVVIKKFMKWLYGEDEYPEQVKGLKHSRNAYKLKTPKDMLSEEEAKKIIKF